LIHSGLVSIRTDAPDCLSVEVPWSVFLRGSEGGEDLPPGANSQ
jgi:hypothetical protein